MLLLFFFYEIVAKTEKKKVLFFSIMEFLGEKTHLVNRFSSNFNFFLKKIFLVLKYIILSNSFQISFIIEKVSLKLLSITYLFIKLFGIIFILRVFI